MGSPLPLAPWIRVALAVGALAGCRRPLDLADARLVLERRPTGLHALDFRGYRAEIGGDGTFTFVATGLDGVERRSQGTIEIQRIEQLFEQVLQAHVFELADHYGATFNDMVLTTLEVRLQGVEKRVRGVWLGWSREELLRAGYDESFLEHLEIQNRLCDLASRIDDLVGTRDRLAQAIALEPPLPDGRR